MKLMVFIRKHINKFHNSDNTNNSISLNPALFIDLIIAGLSAGGSITNILQTLSKVTNNDDFRKIARKILLGLEWKDAYKNTFVDSNKHYKRILATLENAWKKGISPTQMLEKIREEIIVSEEKSLQENIAKLSTKITLPLGVCYLPSFIFLGLLPIIISSGGNIQF
ncbi:type II secretion system F family protein [Actinomyces sp. zg-332]|uniref:type II secretion system F family protein n=1 Tax=Actinomyces sp. zg-332 TaxID=2708340 RepID=UPI0014218790|nr:type II secretion system F family protein [Actinomyces sp. zg-332]QPK94098.1 type II secretion system F family protein [Actinomyces sp. zg-332]